MASYGARLSDGLSGPISPFRGPMPAESVDPAQMGRIGGLPRAPLPGTTDLGLGQTPLSLPYDGPVWSEQVPKLPPLQQPGETPPWNPGTPPASSPVPIFRGPQPSLDLAGSAAHPIPPFRPRMPAERVAPLDPYQAGVMTAPPTSVQGRAPGYREPGIVGDPWSQGIMTAPPQQFGGPVQPFRPPQPGRTDPSALAPYPTMHTNPFAKYLHDQQQSLEDRKSVV